MKRPLNQFYWIKTNGYHISHLPFYFNCDSKWKVEINDSTIFISDYALQLMFGKDCIIRPVDYIKDICNDNEKINAYIPYVIQTESGVPTILLYNNVLSLMFINGMSVPTKIDTSCKLKFK